MRRASQPDGKELCNLLVVFDDTAIIWQIKDLKVDAEGKYKGAEVAKISGSWAERGELCSTSSCRLNLRIRAVGKNYSILTRFRPFTDRCIDG